MEKTMNKKLRLFKYSFFFLNVAVFIFYKIINDVNYHINDLLLGLVIFVLLFIFNKVNYIIWSLGFILSLLLSWFGSEAASTPCNDILCGVNYGGLVAMMALGALTTLLLVIQFIQYLLKKKKVKNPLDVKEIQ